MKDIEYYTLYEMAYELKMSPQEFKNSHTSSEFNDWIAFLEEKREKDWHKLSLSDYYLMQIAMEVVRMAIKGDEAQKLTLSQFLIKFDNEKEKKPPTEMTEEERKEFIYQQKCLFGAIFDAPVPDE